MHVNGEPVIIDFSIQEEKEYSFYVGPALFNLHFKKNRRQFSYELIQDENTPTQLNLARKQSEKQDVLYMCVGAGVVLGGILIVLLL